MKKIFTLAMCLISSSAMAEFSGVWAVSKQACKNDWVRVAPTIITGKDWKCNLVTMTESSTEKVVSAFCGYDRTDVTFQDIMLMSISNNDLLFTFQDGRTRMVKCK
jgi:predicted phosphoadenosine phosphosulfate sulfurtransferase